MGKPLNDKLTIVLEAVTKMLQISNEDAPNSRSFHDAEYHNVQHKSCSYTPLVTPSLITHCLLRVGTRWVSSTTQARATLNPSGNLMGNQQWLLR